MRKLTMCRPRRKLRGLKREFDDLRNWVSLFSSKQFEPDPSIMYCNYKVPVQHRVIEGPKSSHQLRLAVFCEMVRAAEILCKSQDAENHEYFGVAILLKLPTIWQSEVTVFF